jgi:hypothetical protein
MKLKKINILREITTYMKQQPMDILLHSVIEDNAENATVFRIKYDSHELELLFRLIPRHSSHADTIQALYSIHKGVDKDKNCITFL